MLARHTIASSHLYIRGNAVHSLSIIQQKCLNIQSRTAV